jgi:hypothetical protein
MKSPLDAYSHLLGTMPDKEIAAAAGTNLNNVRAYRFRRGIRIAPPRDTGGRHPDPTSIRSQILEWFRAHGMGRCKDVADELLPSVMGDKRRDVLSQVNRLAREGKLLRLSHGTYTINIKETPCSSQ